jgi:DNA-binding IclR family transcriptional regulator
MTSGEPTRTSPPTERVVAVLEFLARHPQRPFGLSELSRQVAVSKPTLLGILTALTEAGYLRRDDAGKTYRLGPALIRLGHTAQESLRVRPGARDTLRELCRRFDTTAALSAVVDDRITLLEMVAPPGSAPAVEVGQSYPFAPPVGLMYVLWDDDALSRWLRKEPTIPLRTDGERLDRVIGECRSSGYLVERLTPSGRRLYAMMAGMSETLPDELRALLGELISDIGERVYLRGEAGSGRSHDVGVISAPVFDHHGRQAMVLSLQIGRSLTDDEIRSYAAELTTAAANLTGMLGGGAPVFS